MPAAVGHVPDPPPQAPASPWPLPGKACSLEGGTKPGGLWREGSGGAEQALSGREAAGTWGFNVVIYSIQIQNLESNQRSFYIIFYINFYIILFESNIKYASAYKFPDN